MQNSFTEDLSEHYLYFKVLSYDQKENINLFFFLLLDIEYNKLVSFDGSIFRNLENKDFIFVKDLLYSDLPFIFQSIQNQCEIFGHLIEKMKNDAQEHYFSTEDFIEIITHYLFFEINNQNEYLTEYLKDITQFILGDKENKENIDISFSWNFIHKSEIINNDFVDLNYENNSYSDKLESSNENQELSKLDIQLSLDIQPLDGIPLLYIKQGNEILVKPVVSDQKTLLAMKYLQPDYKEGDKVQSLWGYVENIEHLNDKTILIVQVENYYSHIEELENYVKVKLKQDDKVISSIGKNKYITNKVNFFVFAFLVLLFFFILYFK